MDCVGHILPSFIVLASLRHSLIFWQPILGCRKNVGEPYPSLLWNIQWDRTLLYPFDSLS